MRKILFVLIFFQLIVLSLCSIEVLNKRSISRIMYDNQTSLLMNFDIPRQHSQDYGNYINKLGEKYKVTFSKRVFLNQNEIIIYTSDVLLKNKISIIEGRIPKLHTNEYISNKNKNDNLQVGVFSLFDSSKSILIKSITQTNNMGSDGVYYIDTKNPILIKKIVNDLNINVAKTSVYDNLNSNMFNINPLLFINIIFVSIVLLVSVIHYGLSQNKVIGILRLSGYGYWRIVKEIFFNLKSTLITSLISFLITITIYYYTVNNIQLFGLFFLVCLIIFIMVSLSVFAILAITTYFQVSFGNLLLAVRGERYFKTINFIHLLVKVAFLVFMLGSINQFLIVSKNLKVEIQSLSSWDKAKNVYRTVVSYTGENDIKREKEVSSKMKKFYNSMKNTGGFVVNTSNYVHINGEYIYNLNNTAGDPSYSPYGKSITVDKNYLKQNPITIDVSIMKVFDKIIERDNVCNILVPKKFKDMEENIKKNFLEDFYFRKVEVDNIVSEKLGEKKSAITKNDLRLNIIYVDNQQSYFTYNSDIEKDNNNKILDPIAIVETGNVHDSYYLSHISSNYFFTTKEVDAYGNIISKINDSDLQSSIKRVESLYDEKGKQIQELKDEKVGLTLFIIILFLSNIVVLYNLIASYYEKYKHTLYIKKIFGFGLIRRSWLFYILIFSINLLTIFVLVFTYSSIALASGMVFMLLELLFIVVFDYLLMKKNINYILKGEH